MSDTHPTGRYDIEGNLYVDFPPDLVAAPLAPLYRAALTAGLSPGYFDWESGAGTVWLRWDVARAVERQLRAMWPDAAVTAVANPGYGARAARIMEAIR